MVEKIPIAILVALAVVVLISPYFFQRLETRRLDRAKRFARKFYPEHFDVAKDTFFEFTEFRDELEWGIGPQTRINDFYALDCEKNFDFEADMDHLRSFIEGQVGFPVSDDEILELDTVNVLITFVSHHKYPDKSA